MITYKVNNNPQSTMRLRFILLVRAATMSRPILLKANILSSQLLDPAEISREKQTASSLPAAWMFGAGCPTFAIQYLASKHLYRVEVTDMCSALVS